MLQECARVFRTGGADSRWDTQYDLGSAYLLPETLCNIHVTDVSIQGKSKSEATGLIKKRVVQMEAGQITKVMGIRFQPVAATRQNTLWLWTVEGEPHESTVQVRVTLRENALLTLRRHDYQHRPALQFCCKGGVIYYREVN